jgi:hypothetical protein
MIVFRLNVIDNNYEENITLEKNVNQKLYHCSSYILCRDREKR